MSVTEDLFELGMEVAQEKIVTDVRIGLGYTAARVEGGDVGLAYTFRTEAGHTCTAMQKAGTLAGQPAKALLELVTEKDVISAAVGLAVLNALLQRRIPETEDKGDFLDLVGIRKGERVGMVGFFAPIIPAIRDAGGELWIFEENLKHGEGLYPPDEIPNRLPHCSVVILSATTLINHTFDEIARHAVAAREIVMLGPSTPLAPNVLDRYGITLLAGMKIVNPDKALQIVSEGGGTQRLRGAVKKVVVTCGKSG